MLGTLVSVKIQSTINSLNLNHYLFGRLGPKIFRNFNKIKKKASYQIYQKDSDPSTAMGTRKESVEYEAEQLCQDSWSLLQKVFIFPPVLASTANLLHQRTEVPVTSVKFMTGAKLTLPNY